MPVISALTAAAAPGTRMITCSSALPWIMASSPTFAFHKGSVLVIGDYVVPVISASTVAAAPCTLKAFSSVLPWIMASSPTFAFHRRVVVVVVPVETVMLVTEVVRMVPVARRPVGVEQRSITVPVATGVMADRSPSCLPSWHQL